MKSRLDLVENTIKALFEGDSALFPWVDEQTSLLHKILESIQENLTSLENDPKEIPGKFSIYLNSKDRQTLEKKDNWLDAVKNFVEEMSSEMGLSISRWPEIEVITRNSLSNGAVLIKTSVVPPALGETGIVPVVIKTASLVDNKRSNIGYLILEDESLFELISPVTNIGRNSTNHLILNDLRVSRTHAQIRTVGDDYIIFDIGSSGGTYINGERISQRKLKPGDVISLAGIRLIFSEEQSNLPEGNDQVVCKTKPISTTEDLQC
jgi:hypothetical protein